MEFGSLFANITDILTYIVPGFIFMLIYGKITVQKIFFADGIHTLLYISISYIINTVVTAFVSQYQLITILFVSIFLGGLVGYIHKQILKSMGGQLDKSNPIDDLMILNDNSTVIAFITLKNKPVRYCGKIFLITDDAHPDYILYDYRIEILDQSGNREAFFDASDKEMYLYVEKNDIERIEFMFIESNAEENIDNSTLPN